MYVVHRSSNCGDGAVRMVFQNKSHGEDTVNIHKGGEE